MNSDRPGVIASLARWIVAGAVTSAALPLAVAAWWLSPRRGMRVLAGWDRLVLGIFGIRLEVVDRNRGRYPAGAYVFVVLNQRSLSETFVVHTAMPVPLVLFTNIEFALLPVGWAMWLTGSVVVVRQWRRQRRHALTRAIAKARAGRSFFISIEGRRAATGERPPFKHGPGLLAIRGGATLVPVVFDGAQQVWPRGEWRVRPGTIRVILLEAISTHGLTLTDHHALTQSLERLAEEQRVR